MHLGGRRIPAFQGGVLQRGTRRIAFVRRAYTPFGGAERFLDQVASRFAERGGDVHLVCETWRGEDRAGLTVHAVGSVPLGRTLSSVLFVRRVREALLTIQPDVTVSFDRILDADIYRAGDGCHRAWLDRRGLRGRLDARFSPFHRWILHLERRLYAGGGARLIAANSTLVSKEISRYYGTPSGRIVVLPNGVDLDRFHPELRLRWRSGVRRDWGIGDDVPVFLFLGSGFERKGLTPLIEALGRSAGREGTGRFLLAVAGKGDPGPYRRAAKRLGIDGDIKWLGPVKDPERLLGAADVFVLPTLYDPFSNACLEAMAAGVPVVTTRDNGAAEVVEEAGAGWVIDSAGDVEGLSRSIAASCDPSERENRGRLAREAASRLSLDRFVEGMVRLIEGLGEKET
ncbi:MAG: hypothetical protein A2V83_07860 [Nitrospirae bacterium RBG_16_64_22]|nr:MAG: hypothetical protein A2V83_07860 [Nitrospirae bacterium RBG_16_64_22]